MKAKTSDWLGAFGCGGGDALACWRSIQATSNPCQPLAIMASAPAFGSGHSANLAAINSAARTVIGFPMRFRWSSTAAARVASRTLSSALRGVLEETLVSDWEGVISLGGVGDVSLGDGVPSPSSQASRVTLCDALLRSRYRCCRIAPTDFAGAISASIASAAIKAWSMVRPASSIRRMADTRLMPSLPSPSWLHRADGANWQTAAHGQTMTGRIGACRHR